MGQRSDAAAVALSAEIADVLARHGRVPCQPIIEDDDGLWTLSVTFRPWSPTESLEVLELATALRRVQDVAQVRAFAETYGIPADRLEALLGLARCDHRRAEDEVKR